MAPNPLLETRHELRRCNMNALARKVELEDEVDTDATEPQVDVTQLKVVPLPRRTDEVYMRGLRRRRA
jgi:hypothetical protein